MFKVFFANYFETYSIRKLTCQWSDYQTLDGVGYIVAPLSLKDYHDYPLLEHVYQSSSRFVPHFWSALGMRMYLNPRAIVYPSPVMGVYLDP